MTQTAIRSGKNTVFIVFAAVLIAGTHKTEAAVKLPSIIGDNMVLQTGIKIPVWGWANPGEKVVVSVLSQEHQTVTDADGRWRVNLNPITSADSMRMRIKGDNEILVKNILIGEVWLASGQSNMHWPLVEADNGKQEVSAANFPRMRLFQVPAKGADQPLSDCEGKWQECTPDSACYFSAVAYFFGRKLHHQLDRPIGIIAAPFGGTAITTWISEESLRKTDCSAAIMRRYLEDKKKYGDLLSEYERELEKWQDLLKTDETKDAEKHPKPRHPDEIYAFPRNYPSRCFNAMIHPLIPYAMQGVIWYQGESDALAGRAAQYATLYTALLNDWRSRWGVEFPIYAVQLTSFANNDWQPDESNNPDWAELRDVQSQMCSLKNSFMAVTVDIGQAHNIHPTNKQDVGYRLALLALANTYGVDIPNRSPVYHSMRFEDNKIILTFSDVYDGLKVKGDMLKEFTICGPDGIFVPAKAEIVAANQVVVYCQAVSCPAAVRYGWRRCPIECNLYNSANLPASPFRTDVRPYVSVPY